MISHEAQHQTPAAPIAERPLPSFDVVSFTDPDGAGGDVACTRGLAAAGRPELLLWARPTEGLDPGADWLLTHRERERLLRRWVAEMANGRLPARAERQVWFDGGDTVAVFRFGPPSVASPLHLPFLEPGTRVVSLNWSLLRSAPGLPRRGAPRPRPAVRRRIDRWAESAEILTRAWNQRPASLERPIQPPGRLRSPLSVPLLDVPGAPGTGRSVSRLLEARVAQVLAAGADVVTTFLVRLGAAATVRCETCLLGELLAQATRAGRHAACREASRLAADLALALTGPEGAPTAGWQRVRSAPTGWLPDHAGRPDLSIVLIDGLELLMVATVLADVVDSAAIAGATGPWEWAAHEQRLPGRPWLARPEVRRTATALLAAATPDQVAQAVGRAREVCAGAGLTGSPDEISGLQTTAAASARPGSLLRREQTAGLPRSIVRGMNALAGQLVTALAEPVRFPEPGWARLHHALGPIASGPLPATPTGPMPRVTP
jgi:hypothetical protein